MSRPGGARAPRRGVRLLARLVLLAVVVAGASACQVRTSVDVDVHDGGDGMVTVSVGLDDDAVRNVGDLQAALRTDDLKAAGWTITGPAKGTDGFTTIRASKPFADAAGAAAVFAEISGPAGPFRDFRVSHERSFAHTKTRFDGTVDFSHGLESFADSALARQLDGKPLGEDISAIEARIGATLDQVFSFRVAVRLPGDVSSNAVTPVANGAVWQPKLSDKAPTVLSATGSSWRVGTLVFTAVSVLAGIAVALVIMRWALGRAGRSARGSRRLS